MTDIAFRSASELARNIRTKEISSEELLQHYFDRIDRFNGELNAIIVQDREAALATARMADERLARGERVGPLHGVPMTVKESYDVEGWPSSWGIPEMKDNIAQSDALPVQRLKQAGAVIFGKTNVPIRLADFQSYNEVYGQTNNPWDRSRTPGGSSGGSAAALAAGLTGFETGSDIGGSIRNPAHYCGVFGHKPTWNLLPMRGHAMPGVLTPSDISVIGPLSRSAKDLMTGVEVMAGPDEIQEAGYALDLALPGKKTLGEFRVAVWMNDAIAPVSREVESRVGKVAQAFKDAGATVDENARPPFQPSHSHEVYENLLWSTMASRLPDADYDAIKAVVAEADPGDSRPGLRTLRAQVLSFRDWSGYNEARTHLRWAWHRFFEDWDLLLTPMMATSAFPHDHQVMGKRRIQVDGQEQPYFQQLFWAGLTGVSYLPSTIIPTGPDESGLPVGIQIVGPEYGDLTTIGAASLLEDAGFGFIPAPDYS